MSNPLDREELEFDWIYSEAESDEGLTELCMQMERNTHVAMHNRVGENSRQSVSLVVRTSRLTSPHELNFVDHIEEMPRRRGIPQKAKITLRKSPRPADIGPSPEECAAILAGLGGDDA